MTIQTLEYIHKLLVDQKKETYRKYQTARALYIENESCEEYREMRDKFFAADQEAWNALDEFETHDWK